MSSSPLLSPLLWKEKPGGRSGGGGRSGPSPEEKRDPFQMETQPGGGTARGEGNWGEMLQG